MARIDAMQMLPLIDSTQLQNDSHALNEALNRDGYLLLRGVLPEHEVARVHGEIVASLRAQGAQQLGEHPDALGLPVGMSAWDEELIHSQVDYLSFWNHPDTMPVFERVVGEPAFVWRYTVIRAAPVAKTDEPTAFMAPPHQDGFFNHPGDPFCTVWVPLAPQDRTSGGVALAVGSHLGGIRRHIEPDEAFESRRGKAASLGVPLSDVTEPWATAESMNPGDVLFFHRHLVHRSLPNRSGAMRLRISMDTRIQPVSSPPQGDYPTHTLLEYRRVKLSR